MVKFKLVSDIHLKSLLSWQEIFNQDDSDYLIFAGDICSLVQLEILIPFLEAISKETHFKRILFVCGNHEYYNNVGFTFDGLLAIFKESTKHLYNFAVLYNQSIDLENNLRLFGGTMWSRIPIGSESIINHPIYDEYGQLITSNWYNCEHFRFLHRLDIEINQAQLDKKRLIVVSHHAPTFDGTLKPRHYKSPNRFLYCSVLDRYLSKDKIYTWMYGHTHVNIDHCTRGDTRIVSNQYAAEGYDPKKIIYINDQYKS